MGTKDITEDEKYYTDVIFDDVDPNDYPDFADAYIVSAKCDGIYLTEAELDELNEDRDLVHVLLYDNF